MLIHHDYKISLAHFDYVHIDFLPTLLRIFSVVLDLSEGLLEMVKRLL
jgi:hypothetical protein